MAQRVKVFAVARDGGKLHLSYYSGGRGKQVSVSWRPVWFIKLRQNSQGYTEGIDLKNRHQVCQLHTTPLLSPPSCLS